MIKLNSKLNTLRHENYPAMTSVPSFGDSLYTKDITCLGFDSRTGVGMQNESGYPCEQDFIESYVQHIRPDTFRITTLPFGYTITFQQHPEGIQEMIDISELDDETNEIFDKIVKGGTGHLNIEDLWMEEDQPEDPEPTVDLSVLEAFDKSIERAREWWFDNEITPEIAKDMKAKVGLSSDSIVGTIDIIRMFINQPEYKEILITTPELPDIQNLAELKESLFNLKESMRQNKVKGEFSSMFSNRMRYTTHPYQRDILAKKIIEWAQSL